MRNLSEYIRGVPGRSADIRKLFSKKGLYPCQSTKMLEDRDYLFFRDGGNVRSAHYDSLMGRLIVMNCEEVFLDDVIFKFKAGDRVIVVNKDDRRYQKVYTVKARKLNRFEKQSYVIDHIIPPIAEEDLELYIEEN